MRSTCVKRLPPGWCVRILQNRGCANAEAITVVDIQTQDVFKPTDTIEPDVDRLDETIETLEDKARVVPRAGALRPAERISQF